MDEFIKWFAGPFLGFLAAVVTFRVTLSDTKKDLVALTAKVASDREHDKELLKIALDGIREDMTRQSLATEDAMKRIERRQSVSLDILAAIARKNNINHRALGVDALVELMGDETNDGA